MLFRQFILILNTYQLLLVTHISYISSITYHIFRSGYCVKQEFGTAPSFFELWLIKLLTKIADSASLGNMNYILPMISLLSIFLLLGSCAQNSANIYPLEPVYTSPPALSAEMGDLLRRSPELCKLHIIGFSSTEGIPIQALEIGSASALRKILVIGQHHGDEVMGIEISMQIARKLLDGSERSRRLLSEYSIWIVPTINPEGWRLVRSGDYQWKRKNNRDTNANGILDLRDDGVDLNRNYPIYWQHDKLVAVSDPYYKGISPASETEIQAIIALASAQDFELAIYYHSSASGAYSEKIYLPAYDRINPRQTALMERLTEKAELYAAMVTKDYKRGNYEVAKGPSSRVGNARNYFFHRHSTLAFLVEVGGINQEGRSVIHPGSKMLQRNRLQHSEAFLRLLYDYIGDEPKDNAQ